MLERSMMSSYNRIIIIGNLTRDPDYKQLTSGQPVTRLGIASNRSYKNKQTGSLVQEVCFIDVDIFGPQAETCKQYLQKGRGVLVEGRLKFDTWQTPDGQTRSKHSIIADRVVFLANTHAQQHDVSESEEVQAEPSKPAVVTESLQKPTEIKAAKRSSQKNITTEQTEQTSPLNTGEFDFKDQQPFEEELPF